MSTRLPPHVAFPTSALRITFKFCYRKITIDSGEVDQLQNKRRTMFETVR